MDQRPDTTGSMGDPRSGETPPTVDPLLRLVVGGIGAGAILVGILMIVRAGAHASVSQALVYYVAPVAMGGGLLWSLRRSIETRVRLVLVMAFTVGSLLICEVVLARLPGRPSRIQQSR